MRLKPQRNRLKIIRGQALSQVKYCSSVAIIAAQVPTSGQISLQIMSEKF